MSVILIIVSACVFRGAFNQIKNMMKAIAVQVIRFLRFLSFIFRIAIQKGNEMIQNIFGATYELLRNLCQQGLNGMRSLIYLLARIFDDLERLIEIM